MALVKIDWKPDRSTLREFSEWWLFFVGMVAAPMAYFRAEHSGHPAWQTTAYVLWCLAVGGRLVGALRPEWLRPLYVGMSLVAFPIGWVISHLAMAILYYGIFTPVGLFFRLIGRDPLQRRFDPQATSYWEPRKTDTRLERYFRQF